MKRTLSLLLAFSLFANLFAQERIKMRQESGIYTIPCEVNGLRLRFIFDTGAADVSISSTEALFMLKNDYLKSEHIIGKDKYVLADGSIEENTIIILEEIKIGTKTLNDIKACVTKNTKAPLLLGQSAIKQLGSWYIEGDELVFGLQSEFVDIDRILEDTPIEKCIEKAREYGAMGKFDTCMQLLKKACSTNNVKNLILSAEYIIENLPKKDFKVPEYRWIYEQICNSALEKNQETIEFLKKSNWDFFYYLDDESSLKYYKALIESGLTSFSRNAWVMHSFINDSFVFQCLKMSAEAGWADAQTELANAYNPVDPESFSHFSSIIVTKNYDQAVYWYKKAIAQGDTDAMLKYGITLITKNNSTSNDKSQGLNYIISSGEKGNYEAMAILMDIFYYDEYSLGKEDNEKALYWAQKVVSEGSVHEVFRAKAIIGMIYYLKKQYEEAITYFKDCFENYKTGWSPDPSYYIYYGDCCYDGDGTDVNYRLAFQNYKKYINQSNGNYFKDYAYYKLGIMYTRGLGVNTDLKNAYNCYKEAANLGHAFAQCELGNIYCEGNAVVNRNVENAIYWYNKAADQGLGYAFYLLGFLYEVPRYGRVDITKAIHYYTKAIETEGTADNILAECNFSLAEIYETGKGGTQKSYTKAGQYYKEAAKLGHIKAQAKVKEFE